MDPKLGCVEQAGRRRDDDGIDDQAGHQAADGPGFEAVAHAADSGAQGSPRAEHAQQDGACPAVQDEQQQAGRLGPVGPAHVQHAGVDDERKGRVEQDHGQGQAQQHAVDHAAPDHASPPRPQAASTARTSAAPLG